MCSLPTQAAYFVFKQLIIKSSSLGHVGGSVVKPLTLAQVMIPQFMSSSPTLGELKPHNGWAQAPQQVSLGSDGGL